MAIRFTDSKTPETIKTVVAKYEAVPREPVRPVAKINAPAKISRAGRPKSDKAKELVTLRLDPAVVDHYRKSGDGWRTRINEDLLKVVTSASPQPSES